jgi:hypothetical protein
VKRSPAPFPTYRQRFPRGAWRVGSGFRWLEYCSGCDAPEHVMCLEALPRRLPAHCIGRRRQEAQRAAWGLVCLFSRKQVRA